MLNFNNFIHKNKDLIQQCDIIFLFFFCCVKKCTESIYFSTLFEINTSIFAS